MFSNKAALRYLARRVQAVEVSHDALLQKKKWTMPLKLEGILFFQFLAVEILSATFSTSVLIRMTTYS